MLPLLALVPVASPPVVRMAAISPLERGASASVALAGGSPASASLASSNGLPAADAVRGPLAGLSVVAGLANPEWPHLGLGYRRGHFGGGLDLGSVRSANALSGVFRVFYTGGGASPYVDVGVSASRLTTLNPSFPAADQTPSDIFFSEFIGAGYQFLWPHMVVNLALGIPIVPPRSAAPPTVLIGSGLLPHFEAEVGYVF